jgi:hypothetical protein
MALDNGPRGTARTAMLCFAMLCLSGCTASFAGEPAHPFDRAPGTAAAGSGSIDQSIPMVPDWLTDEKLLVSGTTYTAEKRNEIVSARMYIIDRAYGRFEGQLLVDAHQTGFITNLSSLMLTTAATAISTVDVKTALSASATIVNGGRTAYSKEVLAEQAVQALQGFMQARRAQVRTQLVERMQLTYGQWPLGLALSDLEAYFRAGTLTGAFLSAAGKSEEVRSGAEKETNSLLQYDAREAEQVDLAVQIEKCFVKLDGAGMDAAFENAASIGLLGDGPHTAASLAKLTGTTSRSANQPTERQKAGYLMVLKRGADGSDPLREARLTLHKAAVCPP